MIELIEIGSIGITHYIDDLIELIKENRQYFITMGKIDDGDKNYSFVAIFNSKSTVGKYSAVISQWSCNDGMSGEGGRGFERMVKFINDNNLSFYESKLSVNDRKKIGYQQVGSLNDWEERRKIWVSYIPMKYR